MSRNATARLALGLACATMWGCSSVTDPGTSLNGTYVLESASAGGPVAGTLILTRQGYAERRVRFREPGGGLSKEYLTRGTATLDDDGTIRLVLREMSTMETLPWTPNARVIDDGIEILDRDAAEGLDLIETYRRR
jgi:hypothetical protein